MPRVEVGYELARVIRNAFLFIPNGKLPRLEIPSFGRRTDLSNNPLAQLLEEYRLKQEYLNLPDPTNLGNFISFSMPPVSPHTPETIKIGDQIIPAHLNVWWGEVGNPNQITILDLARMKRNERLPYLQAIADQIQKSILFLGERIDDLKNIPRDRWHKNLEIYGLCGHATPEERQATGASRGAQSHPSGHINVGYHPYEKETELAEPTPSTPREILKHIGPMDTLIFQWSDFFVSIVNNIIANNGHESSIVQAETHHAKRPDDKLIRFYEGISIDYNTNGIPLVEALNDLSDVIGFFDRFYQTLRDGYEEYYFNYGHHDLQSKIRQRMIDELLSLYLSIQNPDDNMKQPNSTKNSQTSTRTIITEIVDFALSFLPTYQQIINWLNNPNISQKTKSYLKKRKKQYEKIHRWLRQSFFDLETMKQKLEAVKEQREDIPVGDQPQDQRDHLKKTRDLFKEVSRLMLIKQKILSGTQNKFNLGSDLEAEIFLQHIFDMTQPGENWNRIEYAWPAVLSLSFMADDYKFDQFGNLNVIRLTIAPRFGTTKGAIEDMGGYRIVRQQGA